MCSNVPQCLLQNEPSCSQSDFESNNTETSGSLCILYRSSFIQKNIQVHIQKYVDLGDKTLKCCHCGATFWLAEALKSSQTIAQPVYIGCCQKGRIQLTPYQPTPPFLESSLFRDNIRAYNSMFSFTSIGAKIGHLINNGSGPYVFKISRQVHHLMGSLLPREGVRPKFAHLYVYDTQNKIANRLAAISSGTQDNILDPSIVEGLMFMFNDVNELVNFFRMAKEKYELNGLTTLRMTMLDQQLIDSRQYGLPTCDEIGGLVVSDIGEFHSNKDIVIDVRNEVLKRISQLHPKFMSLQYPILFPYGKDGFKPKLKMHSLY